MYVHELRSALMDINQPRLHNLFSSAAIYPCDLDEIQELPTTYVSCTSRQT